jgi:hypothetical protein
MCIRGFFSRNKAVRREADHTSLLPSTIMSGALPPLPHTFMAWYLIMHKDNLTFFWETSGRSWFKRLLCMGRDVNNMTYRACEIIEELLEWKSSGSGQENRINDRGNPLSWPRDTLYPQKLVLTSPTSGGRSVGIVRLRTKGHGV